MTMEQAKPMTTEEYRAALDKLGMSQAAAARLFTVSDRTSRRWALGGSIPMGTAIVLRLMVKKKITLEVPVLNELSRSEVWTLSAAHKSE